MSGEQCPQCGSREIAIHRSRGLGGLILLLGGLLFVLAVLLWQDWFPAEHFWRDYLTGWLTIPESYTWLEVIGYTSFYALISALAVFLVGMGVWMMTVSVLECRQCGHKLWK